MNKYGITVIPGYPFQDLDSLIESIIDAYLAKQDPYAHLKAAAADPTKQIRLRANENEWFDWRDVDDSGWIWSFPPEDYEIRDKPKPMKKVKLLAYFAYGELIERAEGVVMGHWWKRQPHLDRIIEVEDD